MQEGDGEEDTDDPEPSEAGEEAGTSGDVEEGGFVDDDADDLVVPDPMHLFEDELEDGQGGAREGEEGVT